MGDATDMADIDRLLRSEDGKVLLLQLRAQLEGRSIQGISLKNEVHCLQTVLHLSDGTMFKGVQLGHNVDTLREVFADAIEREYRKDFPERFAGDAK